jgi:hypothetical protein
MTYRLKHKCHPYVPVMDGYGPGCAIPWPTFSMLDVGMKRDERCPGNIVGEADGGRWIIVTTWQTGWMAIQSLTTGTVIFSVPPGTLEEVIETD